MASIEEANKFTYQKIQAPKYRSSFTKPFNHTLTLKAGDIVPLYHDLMIPGTTLQVSLSYVIRMLTPVAPIMDNCYIDFYAFSQPVRSLCAKYKLTNKNGEYGGDFETLMGENKTGYWAEEVPTYLNKYGIPLCSDNNKNTYMYRVSPQSVADYMGVIIGKDYNGATTTEDTNEITGYSTSLLKEVAKNIVVNGLPYALMEEIYNYWFRDENIIAPTDEQQLGVVCDIDKNGEWAGYYLSHKYGVQDGDHLFDTDNNKWEETAQEYPFKAAKLHDSFTEALPAPYKGDTIEIGIAGIAPVDITADNVEIPSSKIKIGANVSLNTDAAYIREAVAGNLQITTAEHKDELDASPNLYLATTEATSIPITATGTADLSDATAITIADLRTAFALQHLEEIFATGGSRYDEVLKSLYGTSPSKAELQRPEYLGGSRIPINITQVVQTAQTADGDLGELGAFSHTGGVDGTIISKSFTEFTEVMIVAVIRTDNKYFMGIDRIDQVFELADLYIQQLQGVGEQEVRMGEIYAYAGANLEDIFGYVPRYNQYRYTNDKLSGQINPMSGIETFKPYTFAIPFESQPTLNKAFIEEPYQKVANVLYDQTTLAQFLMDTRITAKITAPIQLYSVPGLTRM